MTPLEATEQSEESLKTTYGQYCGPFVVDDEPGISLAKFLNERDNAGIPLDLEAFNDMHKTMILGLSRKHIEQIVHLIAQEASHVSPWYDHQLYESNIRADVLAVNTHLTTYITTSRGDVVAAKLSEVRPDNGMYCVAAATEANQRGHLLQAVLFHDLTRRFEHIGTFAWRADLVLKPEMTCQGFSPSNRQLYEQIILQIQHATENPNGPLTFSPQDARRMFSIVKLHTMLRRIGFSPVRRDKQHSSCYDDVINYLYVDPNQNPDNAILDKLLRSNVPLWKVNDACDAGTVVELAREYNIQGGPVTLGELGFKSDLVGEARMCALQDHLERHGFSVSAALAPLDYAIKHFFPSSNR